MWKLELVFLTCIFPFPIYLTHLIFYISINAPKAQLSSPTFAPILKMTSTHHDLPQSVASCMVYYFLSYTIYFIKLTYSLFCGMTWNAFPQASCFYIYKFCRCCMLSLKHLLSKSFLHLTLKEMSPSHNLHIMHYFCICTILYTTLFLAI